jgi:hypothetical protein
MKMTKKFSSLTALLLLTAAFNSHSMKRLLEQEVQQKQVFAQAQLRTGEWVDIVGLILTQDAPMQLLLKNFDFKELPEDVQRHIIQLLSLSTTATTLKEAAYTIQSLSLADKKLNEMINNPHMSLQLIKNLAYKFQCSDQEAAEALKTPAAQRQLELQKKLYNLCATYGPSIQVIEQKLTELLLEGADINFTNPKTLLLENIWRTQDDRIDLIQWLIKNGLNINQQNAFLIYMVEICIDGEIAEEEVEIIKIILNASADPEITDKNGHSILSLMQEYVDSLQKFYDIEEDDDLLADINKGKIIIKMFEDAIAKKHAKNKGINQ